MPPRRLAIVAPSQEHGGAEDYLATIAAAAVRSGWEVHAGLSPAPALASIRDRLGRSGVAVRSLSIGGLHRPGGLGAASRLAIDATRTAAFLASVGAAVVLIVLPHPEASPGALLAPAALGRRALVVFQLVPTDLTISARRRRLYAISRRRQRWVAISDENRAHLATAFDLDDERLVRIYNGVPLGPAPTPAERRNARLALGEELGLANDARVILTVGRLSHQKGHDLVLDAAPGIRERVPGAVFVWAGSGELEGELRARIAAMRADGYIRLLGRRADVGRLLAAADLFLFPSRYEGFGLALAEAMIARVPIVAADRSAIPELIEAGRHGLLFELGDRDQLVERVVWAFEHPGEMSAMAARAAERAEERYGEEEMIARTLGQLTLMASGRVP